MQRRDAARLAAGPNRMVIGDRVISPEYTSESSDATSEVSYDTDDFSISEEYDIARRFRTPLPSDDEAGFWVAILIFKKFITKLIIINYH